MAGFKLIETYLSSGSEDEESNNASNSQQIEDQTCNPDINRCSSNNNDNKKLLPSPSNIISQKRMKYDQDTTERRFDDEHDGRIRSFKHERGNWATLVYIQYNLSDSLQNWMTSTLTEIPISSKLIDESHISLTRTLILKFHWISSFVDSLKTLCRNTDKFTMEMTDVKIYCNDEKTRTFLGIECQCLDDSFSRLMKSLNKLLAEYRLPPFYEEASYHISFLWILGDKTSELQPFVAPLKKSLDETFAQNLESNYIRVSEIYCKIGNKIYICPLR